ncbi:hypothetical protein ABK040_015181 [Willaertia magna]
MSEFFKTVYSLTNITPDELTVFTNQNSDDNTIDNNNTLYIPTNFTKNCVNIPNEFLFIFGKVNFDCSNNFKSVMQVYEINYKLIKKIVTGEEMCVILMKDGKIFVNLKDNFILFKTLQNIDFIIDIFVHTFLILLNNKGELFIYRNENGCLNLYKKIQPIEYKNEKIIDIATGYHFLLILTNNNSIYGYGSNKNEFIEKVFTSSSIITLKSRSGKYFIFGYNNNCQFGFSNTITKSLLTEPKLLKTFDNNNIEELACGRYHSIIIDKNKNVFICGLLENQKYPFYSNTNNYINLNLKNYFLNNESFKVGSNYKLNVKMGKQFTIIYSTKLSNGWNFKRSIKLSDITIIVKNNNNDINSDFMF